MTSIPELESYLLDRIRSDFEERSGLYGIEYDIIERRPSAVLRMFLAHPTERFFSILEDIRSSYMDENGDIPLATISKKSGGDLLERSEGQLFIRTLAESQNVNKHSFADDFMSRYTRSVFGAESQITSSANHVTFGRRGAGKSMLLLYAMHVRRRVNSPTVWVDMQVYSNRGDHRVIGDVLYEVLDKTRAMLSEDEEHSSIMQKLVGENLSEQAIRELLPGIRRLLSGFSQQGKDLFIFLDDFHVLKQSLQPLLLDVFYSVARGNKVFLKVSAIETLARTYDPTEKLGLNIPQDIQQIRLDYNLTTPDKATEHIESILNSHAQYSGISSIRRLCTSSDVLSRLTWVAAGVPRDALSLFSLAVSRASQEGRKTVSVSNVNAAASQAMTVKQRELEADASDYAAALTGLLHEIEVFCISGNSERKTNAFLVEIQSNDRIYEGVRNLVDLRFLHVISEGISIGRAGQRYIGLILDYGFYVGVRAARSVELFNKQSKRVPRSELRRLPVFTG